jgi:uncharacterized protein DUF3618
MTMVPGGAEEASTYPTGVSPSSVSAPGLAPAGVPSPGAPPALRAEARGSRPEVDELREEIIQTRAELGETVEALAARADVPARLRETTDEAKAAVRAKALGLARKVEATGSELATTLPADMRYAAVAAGQAARRYRMQIAVVAGFALVAALLTRWRRSR